MIILFNGPPGSGKDVAADFFKKFGFKHLSYKYQLYREVIEHYGVDQKWFMSRYNNRDLKEEPTPLLDGLSCRQAMIHVSEEIIKPKLGQDYFGNIVANEIDLTKNYAISDGGFVEELLPVINKVGKDNFILVQLARDGCSYSSDSRRYFKSGIRYEYVLGHKTPIEEKYVLPYNFDVKCYRINNNSSIEDFHKTLIDIYTKESKGLYYEQRTDSKIFA